MIKKVLILIFLGFCVCISHDSLEKLVSIETNRLALNGSDVNSHFTHFNTTRKPSSKESKLIQSYIIDHFNKLNEDTKIEWEFEIDSFEQRKYNFTNIVLTKSPENVNKYLVIAAHYDTIVHMDNFVGAIDSAVSCGILLDIAETLSPILDSNFGLEEYDSDIGLKIIFFDGEEALKKWSDVDSIYGARHLHKKWRKDGTLQKLELFVLLDLLGGIGKEFNSIPSYFPQSHEEYNELSNLETRLIQIKPNLFPSLSEKYFTSTIEFKKKFRGTIEDDHVPFLRSKIPILHLIPPYFPKQWHTTADSFDLVDPVAVSRWNTLLRVFVADYLQLEL